MWPLCVFPFGDTAELNRVKMWRLCVFLLETQLIKPHKYSRESRDVYLADAMKFATGICDSKRRGHIPKLLQVYWKPNGRRNPAVCR